MCPDGCEKPLGEVIRSALCRSQKGVSAQPEKWDEEIFSQWASTDPVTAGKRALSLPAGGRRSSAIAAIAEAWARTDSSGARKWAEGLPDQQLSIMRS